MSTSAAAPVVRSACTRDGGRSLAAEVLHERGRATAGEAPQRRIVDEVDVRVWDLLDRVAGRAS